MMEDLPVEPGTLVDGADALIATEKVKEMAGNRHEVSIRLESHLESEVTAQLFINVKNAEIEGVSGFNRSTSDRAVRLSNMAPGDECEPVVHVRGENPVIEYYVDYRGFSGEKGGIRDIVEVIG